jgi:hypothetical protein
MNWIIIIIIIINDDSWDWTQDFLSKYANYYTSRVVQKLLLV